MHKWGIKVTGSMSTIHLTHRTHVFTLIGGVIRSNMGQEPILTPIWRFLSFLDIFTFLAYHFFNLLTFTNIFIHFLNNFYQGSENITVKSIWCILFCVGGVWKWGKWLILGHFCFNLAHFHAFWSISTTPLQKIQKNLFVFCECICQNSHAVSAFLLRNSIKHALLYQEQPLLIFSKIPNSR